MLCANPSERRVMPMSEKVIVCIYYITKLLVDLVNEHKNNRLNPDKK